MTVLLLLTYVALAALALVLIVALVRIIRSATGGRRAWVERSGKDRRQRPVPVRKERRRKPRRQEDIARQFLDGVDG
ncbi:MAG: hypothetical protein GXP47_09915 [Acidobacteria bacterium]|nr:hypothetical protein [Acidobacteriota bacterium]